ncbi:MAG: hypothetical protein ACKVS8_02565 [Phycisphaerales bacterium]
MVNHSASAQPAPAARKPLPTLDQLLGLAPADGEPGSPATSPDAGRQELDQRLKEPSIDDQFEEAVGLMGRSASRLTTGNDTGLDTQRIQEDTLKKLDALISQMQKQQQQQQSKNSQQQPQPQGEQRDQPKPEQASRAEQRSNDSSMSDAPARRDGPLRPGLESAKAAWGALPARIREMLLQGSGEKFSSGYDKLTEDYYKKLAEQRP